MKRPDRPFAIAIILLAICGLLIAMLLMHEHYLGREFRAQNAASAISDLSHFACGDQSSYFNCEEVDASRYSSLLGFPLSAWGIMYFLVLGATAALWAFSSGTMAEFYFSMMALLALFGVVFDFAMLMISVFLINSVCPLCTASYLPTLAALILIIVYVKRGPGFTSLTRPFSNAGRDAGRGLAKHAMIFFSTVLLAGGAAATGDYVMKNAKPKIEAAISEKSVQDNIKSFFREPLGTLGNYGPCMIGSPDATVIITVFSDFMCSHCARTAAVLEQVVSENPGIIAVVFMNYPLDMSCNSNIERTVHDGACMLARASLCAAAQGKFKAFHDALFISDLRSSAVPRDKIVRDIAVRVGLDMKQFDLRMASPDTAAELKREIALGALNGVKSTPTLFINGRQYRFRPDKNTILKIAERIIAGM